MLRDPARPRRAVRQGIGWVSGEEQSPVWWWRGAHLAVLWAFAVVQPLLDLLGNNAEFFVARGNGAGDVIAISVAATLLPPLALLALEALAGLVSARAAWLLHLLFVGVLLAMFTLQLLDGFLDVSARVLVAGALALGLAGAFVYGRSDEARSLVSLLAPAPLVFLILFLFFSDASDVVLPDDEPHALAAASEHSPLVVVLFDELATASLMDGHGGIEEKRFPAFAELASEGTWYRNATTVADHTDDAVPALLTGQRPDAALDPLAADYPENLFTLFAGERRLNVHERTTRLCPESFCEAEAGSFGERMRSLVSDLGVVSAHLLLPESLTTGLPPVNEGFEGFGEPAAAESEDLAHVGVDQGAITAFLDGIDDEPRSLHFIHLLLPHVPWRYLPNGQDYVRGDVWREFDEDGEVWPPGERWLPLQAQRAHLLQTGYADAILGSVIDRMRAADAWDDALLVVLADHGVAFTPGSSRRYANERNVGEIAPMPLFVKAPGQDRGRIDERDVTTLDVLPTIAEMLGVEIPFEVDGVPAARAPAATSVRILGGDEEEPRSFDLDPILRARDAAATRLAAVFGEGWRGVWRMGPHPELIGRPVSSFDRIPTAAGSEFALTDADAYADVDTGGTFLPSLLSGRLTGVEPGAPLAVAINGSIAAVGEAYASVGGGGLHCALLAPPASFRDGANEVALYEVVAAGGRVALRPLPDA
jgi:hypothetical protein